MISNRWVFDEEYLPPTLDHRSSDIRELSRAFEPALSGRSPEPVLIHGPSGVGKTALARYTLEELDEYVDVDHALIQCMGLSTADILQRILDATSASPAATDADTLAAALGDLDTPMIVVLDEADGLPETDVLEYLLDVDALAPVVICHDPDDWLAHAGDAARQAFAGAELGLDRYTVAQLTSILRRRAEAGLRGNVYDRAQLATIADEVAGVARYGIQALRAAAEIAVEREHRKIRPPDLRDAFPRARQAIRGANLDSLPWHHHVLYEIVRLEGPLATPEIHDRYEAIADDVYAGLDLTPVGQRSRRHKLAKLRDYDLLAADGENRWRTYRVRDETLTGDVDLTALAG